MTRRRTALAALLAVVLALTLTGCRDVQQIQLVNAEREGNGLAPVLMAPDLAAKAQRWAETLAASGQLAHSNLTDGLAPGWRTVGENVAVAVDVTDAHRALMRSPEHRANILGAFTHAGFGAAQSADGRWWLAQVFAA